MARWIGALMVAGYLSMVGWCPAEAKDRPVAKSLTRTGSVAQGNSARTCVGEDVLGNWTLVTFDSSYGFRNPQAPYLFPYQVFQYSNQGGAKSAHSRKPILETSDQVFGAVPQDMTYRVERGGHIVIKTKGQNEAVETWSCRLITQDSKAMGDTTALQRGDLVMTLMGSNGQALFVRHLRKSAA